MNDRVINKADYLYNKYGKESLWYVNIRKELKTKDNDFWGKVYLKLVLLLDE